MKIGVFVALPREARAIFGSSSWVKKGNIYFKKITRQDTTIEIIACGQGEGGVIRAFSAFKKSGVQKIINLGVVGALIDGLEQGDLIVPNFLLSEYGEISLLEESEKLKRISKSANSSFKVCKLFTSREVVCSPSEKKRIYFKYGACAVDMEAFYMARLCKESSFPFSLIKAVSDSSSQAIPREILKCSNEMGKIDYINLIKELILKPFLIKDLITIGRGFRLATKSLEKAFNSMVILGIS